VPSRRPTPRRSETRKAPAPRSPHGDGAPPTGHAPANETGDGGQPSRALWTGSIGFGLVQIPVRLYPRERSNDLAFHQVDRRDHALIGYERVNKETRKPVAWGDIVKGYEIRKGEYVVVTDEDFEKANVQASRSIDIQDFVPAGSIEAAFFDRPYFLAPDKRGNKAYFVLRDVLARKGLAAVALVVIRTRQHLCAVSAPEGDFLALELLRFSHELRPAREVLGAPERPVKATAKESALAEQLIDQMVVDWDPGKYRDSYRDDLLAAIREKAETGAIEPRNVPPKRGAAPIDLASLLEKSVAGARRKKGGKRAA
jgi:DNA end-binding protein Ku